MTTLHQPGEVIATYKFIPSSEESTSDSSNSSIDIDLTETYTVEESTHNITSLFPKPRPTTRSSSIDADLTRSYNSTPPAKEETSTLSTKEQTPNNIITISKIPKDTPNPETHTHIAHIILDPWTARFLGKYDEPAGIIHDAKVIDMNESTQEATGSRREQDEKAMTRKQELEENRADVAFGVFKKPRSKTVGLCTLMERDEEGWGGREGMSGEEGMVSYIAGRVVGGAQMGGSEVVGCGKPRENDGRSEDQEVRGRRRKREGS